MVGTFNPPISYNDMGDVRDLARELEVDLKGTNDTEKLEKLIEALGEREMPREQTGGMFIGIAEEDGGKGKVVYTGKIVRFDDVEREQLAKFLI